MARTSTRLKGEWTSQLLKDLVGGYNDSVPPQVLADNESPDLSNLAVVGGVLQLDTGYKAFGATVIGYPQTTYQIFYSNGTDRLILITTLTMYYWSETYSQWWLVGGGVSTTISGAQPAAGEVEWVDRPTHSIFTGGAVDFVDVSPTYTYVAVASSTGFVVGRAVGLTMDNGAQHITTIHSVPDATHIELEDGIPAGRTLANGAAVVQGPLFAGTLDKQVCIRMWVPGDYVLFTNGVNYIQKYDGTTCATLAGLPSAGQTTATAIEIFENYVLLLGTTEGGTAYPQRVRRCDTGDPTNWSTGNAGYDDLMDTEDFILTSEPLGIYIMIYRERSIMRCGYIGTSVQLFQFDYMITGEGPCSSLAVANVGDYHIFFGNSNIYRYEGGVSLDPVGDKVFYKLFGSGGTLNTPYKNRVFGLYVEELDEVWFMLPHASSTVPSLLIRWQLGVEAWSFREFYHDLLGYGFYQLTASRTWDDLVGSWDSQSWKWDERRILSGAPTTLLCGHNPKQVYEYDYLSTSDNGNTISWYFVTKDFADPTNDIRTNILEFEAKGTSLDVYISLNSGVTWEFLETVTLASSWAKYRVWHQRTTRSVTYKLSGASGRVALKWMNIVYWQESRW